MASIVGVIALNRQAISNVVPGVIRSAAGTKTINNQKSTISNSSVCVSTAVVK
jgi:hypothetical protein